MMFAQRKVATNKPVNANINWKLKPNESNQNTMNFDFMMIHNDETNNNVSNIKVHEETPVSKGDVLLSNDAEANSISMINQIHHEFRCDLPFKEKHEHEDLT